MKNYIGRSHIITIIAPSDLTVGVPFAIKNFIVIPQTNAFKGETIAVVTEGVVLLTIAGSVNFCDCLYFHSNGNSISTSAADGICCGFALEDGQDNEIRIMLNKSIPVAANIDLNAYLKTTEFNNVLIEACHDASVKAALKEAVQS